MKEKYIAPEMEIVEFDCEDVITTSSDIPLTPVNPDDNETEILK